MAKLTVYMTMDGQQLPLVEYTYTVTSTNTQTTLTGQTPVKYTTVPNIRIWVGNTLIWDETSGSSPTVSTNTKTVNRTTSAQSQEIKMVVVDFDGTHTSTGTMSIPALATYAVTYNANGHGTAPSGQTKTYGTALTLRAAITATGYSFKRWNTKSDDTGTGYNASASYTSNAALSLYAIWNRTITYNANGGTSAPSAQTAIATSAITITSSTPSYTGFSFKDWNTKADGTGTVYASGASYAANNASITLYARWNHTVTYNNNGGTGSPTAQTQLKTAAITLSSTKPTYTGYTFKDWNTKADGTGTTYASGGTLAANAASVTLYARWNHTVSYNANGGSGAPSAQTALKTAAITLSSTTPTLSGYSFKDWTTGSDGSGTAYSAGGSYPANTVGTTLYARWNRTITYNANGGTNAPSAQTALKTSAITITSSTPTRSGYRFKNWNTSADGTGTNYASGGNYAANNPNLTLYAIWDPLITNVTIGNVSLIRTDDVSMLPGSEPTEADEGEYVYIKVPYTVEGPAAAAANNAGVVMTVSVVSDSGTDPTINRVVYQAAKQAGDTPLNGTFKATAGLCDTDIRYTFTVTVTATNSTVSQTAVSTSKSIVAPTAFYTLDVKEGGHGIHFGGAATETGFHVSMPMTLHVSNATTNFGIKNSNIQRGVAATDGSYQETSHFTFYDRSGLTLGYVNGFVSGSNGVTGIRILGWNTVSGESKYNGLAVGVNPDGSAYVGLSGNVTGAAAAWRTALGVYSTTEADNRYVNVSGDTMTGALTLTNGLKITGGASQLTSPPYFLTLNQSFADGGAVGWISSANVPSAISVYTKTEADNRYVNVTGDTMTGNLIANATDTSIRRLTASNSAGSVSTYVAASGNHGLYSQTHSKWIVYANTSGGVYINGLNMSSAADARSAIGAVNKAGDTMTGNLIVSSTAPQFITKQTGADVSKANNNRSSTCWNGVAVRDTSDRTYGAAYGFAQSDGLTGMGLWAYNFNTSGTQVGAASFAIRVDKSGNASYSFSNPAGFRYALGASTAGVWPASVGGTGTTTGIKAWAQIAQVQGTNSATYTNYGGYSCEAMLMIWYSTSYLGTASWPCSSIGATQYEIYTGGGRSGTGTAQRKACAKVSNAKLTGVQCVVDGSSVDGSAYYRLYAR